MVRSCEQALAAGLPGVAFTDHLDFTTWTDGDEQAELVEPADAPAALEPPARKPVAPAPPDSDGGEVYVITSAKPRQPGW